jgi:DNA-binding SARP family transcriptional activator
MYRHKNVTFSSKFCYNQPVNDVQISLLGHFQVTREGMHIRKFPTDKAKALLAFLAVEGSHPHPREYLAGMLWPDLSNEAALHNLRLTILRLRAALTEASQTRQKDTALPLLLCDRKTMQFNPDLHEIVDVNQFEAITSAVDAHVHPSLFECEDCIHKLEQAMDLYQGSLLVEFSLKDSLYFDEWLISRRERLQQQALDSLASLCNFYTQRSMMIEDPNARKNSLEKALLSAKRQLAIEPWRESAHRQMMLILEKDGQREAAMAQFLVCRRILNDELAVEPDEETQDLYHLIRQKSQSRFPAVPPMAEKDGLKGTSRSFPLDPDHPVEDARRLIEEIQGKLTRSAGYQARFNLEVEMYDQDKERQPDANGIV